MKCSSSGREMTPIQTKTAFSQRSTLCPPRNGYSTLETPAAPTTRIVVAIEKRQICEDDKSDGVYRVTH